MPASGSPTSLAEKHFRELFSEADVRLRAVRVGDAESMQEAAKALALAEDISVDTLASDSRTMANPHFSEMLRFVEAVNTGDMVGEDPATHQYDTILAASLKVMLREAMFAKDGLKRQAYVSRVHEWFEANSGPYSNEVEVGKGKGPKSDSAFTRHDTAERQRERDARAARYTKHGPNWTQPRPKSATTNVFLAGTTAGDEYSSAMKAKSLQVKSVPTPQTEIRPQSAGIAGARFSQGKVPKRPQTAGSIGIGDSSTVGSSGSGFVRARRHTRGNDHKSHVAITGRLSQGGFRVRNLFRSQRNRVQSNVTSRAEKRRQFNNIAKAEQLHRADLSNYGHSMVSDSFGVRGASVELGQGNVAPASPEEIKSLAWNLDIEAQDGEITVLAGAAGAERVPPAPQKGSKEAIELAKQRRNQEIAFGAAIRRDEALRPPPDKTTSKKGGKGKKKKGKKKGGKKKGGKKKGGKEKGKASKGDKAANAKNSSPDENLVGMLIPRPSDQPFRTRRPMSSQGRRTMREVESIKQAFTRRNMQLPCPSAVLENALGMPEETPYSECIASLPLPGASFLSDPLAAERKALKALYMKGQKGKGGGGKSKKKKKRGKKKKKK
eukprot:g5110.t1